VTVERLDDALLFPAIADSSAHRPQGTLQRRVTDAPLGPHLVAQFLFVHNTLTMPQKV
jgi:hypothetical protein